MLTGWLIYRREDAKENETFIEWFRKEAAAQDINIQLLYRENMTISVVNNALKTFYDGSVLQDADLAVVRTREPILSTYLEDAGIPVFNSSSVSTLANHKGYTHLAIHKLGIPMPDTIFLSSHDVPQKAPFPYPFVVKEVTGRGGNEVYMVENHQDWENAIKSVKDAELIMQECITNTGVDVRVFVVGNEIIGAVKRMNKNDFRSNYKLGGSVRWYDLKPREHDMVQTILDAFDFDMAGLDFLVDEDDNLLFNEIEDVVGSRSLSKVSDVNILEAYITHIKTAIDRK